MDTNTNKRQRTDDDGATGEDKDAIIARLQAEVSSLRESQETFYSSTNSVFKIQELPEFGMPAAHAKERIVQNHELDNRPRLNTSSYVNVVSEPEERDVALMGLQVNLADGSVYPASIRLHDQVVNMIAEMWNCPKPPNGGNYCGAGTVGSTEGCLLAGLALKFRWRKWYAAKNGLTEEGVVSVLPNLIISSCYQAAWEKFFRYFDVQPRFIYPKLSEHMCIDASEIKALVDEKTIGVVGILGNHYNGAYDPIWDIDKVVSEINAEKGLQVAVHVDAASGGFIAPFQDNVPPFDFRLDNVMSISASGHKFGESVCGTGWVVFRHREDLAEHISVSVTYLGGVSDSMTLNFSRSAAGPYVQLYKFLRLGKFGYKRKVQRQLDVTSKFREMCRELKWQGKPVFQICDCNKTPSLPVFAARFNPGLKLDFNDHALQHAMGEFHWYVGAYDLSFPDEMKGGAMSPLLSDEPATASMFRVVFKSNLTHALCKDLFRHLNEVLEHAEKEQAMKSVRMAMLQKPGSVKRRRSSAHVAC